MMSKNLSIAIFALLLFCVLSDLPERFSAAGTVNLIDNIANMGYSPDHKLLIALKKANKGSFFVYDGIRLTQTAQIPIKDTDNSGLTPSAFAFAHDNSMLVVGTEEGRVCGFTITDGKIDQPYKYHYVAGSIINQTVQQIVASVSISLEKQIVVGARSELIVLGIPTDLNETSFVKVNNFTTPHKVQSVACSPKQANIVLYGCVGQDDKGVFGVYNISVNSAAELKQTNTMSVAFFPDGNTIVQGLQASNMVLYSYSDTGYEEIGVLEDTADTTEIMISQNGEFLGAEVSSTGRVRGWKISFAQKPLNLINGDKKTIALQVSNTSALDQPGQNLAFSNNGNQLLIIPVGGSGTVPKFTLCGKGTYFKDNACAPCQTDCEWCFDDTICLACENTKYLQNDACVACSNALPGCTTCSNNITCITCDTTTNWKPDADPNSHKCVCQSKYVDDNNACVLCSQKLTDCDVCKDVNTCEACKNQDNFDPQPNGEGKCVCLSGWTLDGTVCKACPTLMMGCLKCSAIDICTDCDTVNNFALNNSKCECKSTFYLKVDVCESCDKSIPDCATCSQDGATCDTCLSPNKVPSPDKKLCECQPHYYEDPDTKQCKLCDQFNQCLVCTPDKQCQKCDVAGHWKEQPEAGACVCQQGYVKVNDQCKACEVKGCDICTTQTTCDHCSEGKNFNPTPVNQTCSCKQNFKPDSQGDECFDCGHFMNGCVECDSNTTCTGCDTNQHFELNTTTNLCQCQTQYFKDKTTCTKCDVPIKYCSVCSDNSTCTKCKDGFDPDTVNNKCIGCQTTRVGCQVCLSTADCDTCNDAAHFQSDGNKGCKCKKGFFLKGLQCLSCKDSLKGCLECNIETQCLACDGDTNFEPVPIQNKTCVCKPDFYPHIDGCALCSTVITGCLTCTQQDPTTCSQCDAGANFVINQQKKCDCMSNYYLTDKKNCELCSKPLQFCEICKSANACDTCKQTFTLDQTTKTCKCVGQNKEVNNDGMCVDRQSGLSTLAIIAIIVGVLALAGGVVGIIKCCKKKQSPLEDDEYEALEGEKSK